MHDQAQIQMTAFELALTNFEDALFKIDQEGDRNPSYPHQRELANLFIVAAGRHLFVIRETCPSEYLTESTFKAEIMNLMKAILALTEGAVKAFRHAVQDHSPLLTDDLITLASSLLAIMQSMASGNMEDAQRILMRFTKN